MLGREATKRVSGRGGRGEWAASKGVEARAWFRVRARVRIRVRVRVRDRVRDWVMVRGLPHGSTVRVRVRG